MATLTLAGESDTRITDTKERSSLGGGIAKTANRDAWIEGPYPTTPTRSIGIVLDNVKDLVNTVDYEPFAYCNSTSKLPSESVTSTVSSRNDISDIWDTPQTPCRTSNQKLDADVLTPITPPTPFNPTGDRVPRSLTLRRIQNMGKMIGKVEASVIHAVEKGGRKEILVKEDEDFEPKKLVRGLTAEFLATNATAAQGKFNPRPTFNFCANITRYTPALAGKERRTHSKVTINDEVRPQSRDAKTYMGIVSQIVPSKADLRILIEEIVPCDLQERLEDGPLQCVASLVKKPQQRCSYKAKAPWNFNEAHLKSLSPYLDSAPWIEHVGKMIQTILCGTHQNSAKKRLEKLQRLLASSAHIASDGIPYSSDAKACTSTHRTCDASPPHKNKERRTRGAPQAKNGRVTEVALLAMAATVKLKGPALSSTPYFSPVFYPYRPKKWEGVTVQAALSKTIKKPLTSKDLDDGFIYIFWDVKHFGMMKIGRTNDLQRRLKEWNRDCKRTHRYHTQLPLTPHVGRVEHLIHRELKEHRRCRKCDSCGKVHDEWFEVEEAQVIQVFQKWHKWISQKPYALDVSSGKWEVRIEMLASLPELCEPVLLPLLPQHNQRKHSRK